MSPSPLFPDFLITPVEVSQTIYAAVRDGADSAIDARITDEGFEPADAIPGWGDGAGWHFYVKHLCKDEEAA